MPVWGVYCFTKSTKIFHPEIWHCLQIFVEKKGEIHYGVDSNYSVIPFSALDNKNKARTFWLGWNSHLLVLLFLHLQAIGVRLNELCHAESESPANLLGLIYDEETKRRLRKEDEEEDFLDDSKETPFTTRTPACKNLCFRST